MYILYGTFVHISVCALTSSWRHLVKGPSRNARPGQNLFVASSYDSVWYGMVYGTIWYGMKILLTSKVSDTLQIVHYEPYYIL